MTEYPAIEAALKSGVPDIIIKAWALLAGGDSATGGYVRGLFAAESIQTDWEGNPLALVIQNVAPHAIFVDEGHTGFHLPSVTKKWKTTSKGKRYVVVPFRHFGPSGDGSSGRAMRAAMAPGVARAVRGGQTSFPVPHQNPYTLHQQSKSYVHYRAQGWPNVPQAQGYTWKAGKYENIQATSFPTPGGGSQTGNVTFRVYTPESQGFYIPPLPGKHYPEQVVQQVGQEVADLIARATGDELAGQWAAHMQAAGAYSVLRVGGG